MSHAVHTTCRDVNARVYLHGGFACYSFDIIPSCTRNSGTCSQRAAAAKKKSLLWLSFQAFISSAVIFGRASTWTPNLNTIILKTFIPHLPLTFLRKFPPAVVQKLYPQIYLLNVWFELRRSLTFRHSSVLGNKETIPAGNGLSVRGSGVFYWASLAKAVIPLPMRHIYRHYRTGQSSARSSAISLFYYILFSLLIYCLTAI